MAFTLPVNKFLGALSNLVTVLSVNDTFTGGATAPLLEFAHSDDIVHGSVKSVKTVNSLAVNDYSESASPWTISKPTVHEEFFEVAAFKTIPLTLNAYLLRGAFYDESKAGEFMSYVRGVMDKSRDIFMYKLLIDTLEAWVPAESTQTVTIETADTKAELGKNIAEGLLNTIGDINDATTSFNDLGYEEDIGAKDLTFLCNSKYDSLMIVNTYATLFNSQDIKDAYTWDRTISIPRKKIADEKTIGWLLQKGKLIYGYGYNINASIFNPANLTEQNFLQFSYYIGMPKGLTGVKLVEADS